ncbi:hypothetical protein ACJX0J_016457, partial [Zea mays]
GRPLWLIVFKIIMLSFIFTNSHRFTSIVHKFKHTSSNISSIALDQDIGLLFPQTAESVSCLCFLLVDLLVPLEERSRALCQEVHYMVAHSLHRHSESLINAFESVAIRVVQEIMKHRYSPIGPALG